MLGCSSASRAAGASAPDADVSCTDDASQPDSYMANMAKPGAAGAMTFVLERADPAPPGVYDNTWLLKLLDASGQPIVDATFPTIKTWMPLHGHPSSVAPTAAANGDGTYTIGLYLFMPGLWQITFDAQSGGQTDSAMFTFCVGQ